MSSSDILKVFTEIDRNVEKYIENLAESVAIPSISAEPEHRADCVKMVEYTKHLLEGIGASVELENAGEQKINGSVLQLPPIIFASLKSPNAKKTLLVYGHLDVQPAAFEDGWNTQPFTLTEKNGKLFGRGSTDDKGPVLAWIQAIAAMQEVKVDLPINIKFVFECMEESGSEGLVDALKRRKDDFLSDINFICISDNYWLGKNKPCITYGLRGINYFFVTVEGARQDLHSGCYGGNLHEAMDDVLHILGKLKAKNGDINIPELHRLIAELTPEEAALYDQIDFSVDEYKNDLGVFGMRQTDKNEILMRRWRYPSLSVHGIEGAFAGTGCKTVIPSKVTGKFSIRTVPNMTPEKVDQAVINYINGLWAELGSPNKLRVTSEHSGEFWLANTEHPNFAAGSRAIKQVFGVTPDFTREGGSIPITLDLQKLTNKNVMLLPIGACDDMAHSQNEKINRVNYINGIKVLAAYIIELKDADDN